MKRPILATTVSLYLLLALSIAWIAIFLKRNATTTVATLPKIKACLELTADVFTTKYMVVGVNLCKIKIPEVAIVVKFYNANHNRLGVLRPNVVLGPIVGALDPGGEVPTHLGYSQGDTSAGN